ncbi:MAG: N-acetyl-alpha-D-glucosaminyl L-malate synthase BshA [Bdellovibrionales bacterium]|nr:N-acetyl-alpha-D-glucosaminyl L-malate synthase BshA [Bdellovibrionales bacterium]
MTGKQLCIGITCFPTFGGSGVVAAEIGMAMAKRGHKIHFIAYDVPRRLERFTENIYFHEVEVSEYPLFAYTPYSLALSSKMVEVASYEKLDLFHVHYAVPHATSAYLAKQVLGASAPKVITTLHGTDITLVGNDRSYLPITRFSIMESDGVTTPSLYLKHATYDKLNVASSKEIAVIPNFVDTERYQPVTREDRCGLMHLLGKCAGSGHILTHVSNFRPVKRLTDVIEIFKRVNEESPSHLILVGDGPERSRIENMVRTLGLESKVCFLGKQDTFTRVLQNSDLFLLPSENESFGLAALEAMACGVPVIASNAEGIPEVVADGETGYLSEIGNVDDMARNALALLTNPKKHEAFSRAARERVVKQYSLPKLIEDYEQYYYKVLGLGA